MVQIARPLFRLGQVTATPGALRAMERAEQTPIEFLQLHISGNWGTVDQEDWESNDHAVEDETRILSCYLTKHNERLWIITEWDRSVTTLLLPSEY